MRGDAEVDWAEWLRRWEAQQSSGLPGRDARFQVIVNVVRHVVGDSPLAVDLGCGPGSLEAALERAGFGEVGTVWQRYEDRVLVAIR